MPLLKAKRRAPTVIMRADRAREAGQWQLAARLYRIALDRTPNNPPIWIQYGHALKEDGNHTEAEAAYKAALAYDPNNADAQLHLGHVLKVQGKIPEARAAYHRAAVLDNSLTDAARELHQLDGTELHLAELVGGDVPYSSASQSNDDSNGAEATKRRKRRKPSLITRADRARDSRRWDLAGDLYRKALDRNPRRPEIWTQYGHALKEVGQWSEAEAAYRTAIAREPRNADTRLQLGHLLKLQRKQAEAEAAYLHAFVLNPQLLDALRELSQAGWSPTELAELRGISGSQDFEFDDINQALGKEFWSPGTHFKLSDHSLNELGRLFDVDLAWLKRRYPSLNMDPAILSGARPRDCTRILADRGIDFSPFVSVRLLQRQFPNYDFSSGKALISFLDGSAGQFRSTSVHWLFDEAFYRTKRNQDSPDSLIRLRLGYYDFLLNGLIRGLRPHRLFHPDWYRTRLSRSNDSAPFVHFIREGVFEDLSPTPLFDPEFYRAMYPDVGTSISNGTYSCSLEHFISEGLDRGLSPNADWDADYYLERNPDVAEGVASGLYSCPFQHWLQHGIRENRSPNAQFDPDYYLTNYPNAVEEIRRNDLLGSFEHFAMFGRHRRWLARAPLHTLKVPIEQAKALYLKRCELSVFRARTWGGINFECQKAPLFSVVISAYNNFAYNIRVLELLEHAVHYTKSKLAIGIEVVVVDNGSTDGTVRLENYAKGIVFRRVSPNIGFPRACNLGASLASGEYLLFLNNDVEFEPDVFVRLYEAISADSSEVACFGGAVLQFDGTIQDLGSGISRDGVAQGYFRNEIPTQYAFSYPRDVDYVAGCFFCISATEFRALGGFDERYSPGYYEESDLALRLWKMGRKSRVYPDIRIYHLEFGAFSSGTTSKASFALMARNRDLFAKQHSELVATRTELGPTTSYAARHVDWRPRILFIEHTVPSRKMGSGYGRSETIARSLVEIADVDLFAIWREPYMIVPDDFAYIPITFGPSPESLYNTLQAKQYDAVYICRTPNLRHYDGVLAAWKRRSGGVVVCDTEAVGAIRETARISRAESYAALTSDYQFEERLQSEFRGTEAADFFVAVNNFESAIVRRHTAKPVRVIGHYYLLPRLSGTPATSRSGLFFLGSLDAEDGPNYDGLVWFLANVWPKIKVARPTEQLRIAGLVRPGVSLAALAGDGVVNLGQIEDPEEEFARARVFIAPTRFAAGIPFKVQEAMSYGLPVVASLLIEEQLRYTGQCGDILTSATVNDDGQSFAAACLHLLADDALWCEARNTGLAYVKSFCDPVLLKDTAEAVVDDIRSRLPTDPPSVGNPQRPRTIDLYQSRAEIALVDTESVFLAQPIGIFVHIFYEDLAEEIAGYLTRIDMPKRIYVSTGSEEKRRHIESAFHRFGLKQVSEMAIVPDYGTDIAPLLIQFADKLPLHEICLKVHSKKSLHSSRTFGEGWRTHLFKELIGNRQRARAIVATMLADRQLGVLMPEHYYRVADNINIGPNYERMQKLLAKIDVDLEPDQPIEFPSGSMFWFRSNALLHIAKLGLNWFDFGRAVDHRDTQLEHGVERCFLFFCASAGKKWGFLPLQQRGERISRDEAKRLIIESGVFDQAYYRSVNPDVVMAGTDPIDHWLSSGWREGRHPSDPRNPNLAIYQILEHYIHGLRKCANPNDGDFAVRYQRETGFG